MKKKKEQRSYLNLKFGGCRNRVLKFHECSNQNLKFSVNNNQNSKYCKINKFKILSRKSLN